MSVQQLNEIGMGAVDCIKPAHGIGYTEYYNVCTGEYASIMWGTMDWFSFIGIIILMMGAGLVLIVVLVLMAPMVAKDTGWSFWRRE